MSKKPNESKRSKLSNRFSNELFVFLKKLNMMMFLQNFLKLHYFLLFQEDKPFILKKIRKF